MHRPWLLAVLAAVLLAAPAAAPASRTQESWIQDDNLLLYDQTDPQVAATLDELRVLGVDRIRVTVKWSAIAPDPQSTRRPDFDATDPAAYPAADWRRTDRLVTLAYERGIRVNFNLTGPIPRWASTSASPDPSLADTWAPDPAEFERFATAVGRRYDGSYVPPGAGGGGGGGGGGPLPLPIGGGGGAGGGTGQTGAALPRVDSWSIWNEPNQPGWLSPQSVPRGKRWVDAAPSLYRRLVGAGYRGLRATGHLGGGETFLIGELASRGSLLGKGYGAPLKPLPFLRELYCVDRRGRPLKGAVARSQGCPTSGARRRFRAGNPGLFAISGLAHHPYSLTSGPAVRSTDRDFATLAETGRLEKLIDGIFRTYGAGRRGGVPIYFTEYGYQSSPPDPFQPFSPARQAALINQAEWMAWSNPRVRAWAQFQLEDDRPVPGAPVSSPAAWSTFQSGLKFAGGRRKPAWSAWRLPVHVVRRSRSIAVWGLVRPGAPGATQVVRVQTARPAGKPRWTSARTVRVRSARGGFVSALRARGSLRVRLAWTPAGGARTIYSRVTRAPSGP